MYHDRVAFCIFVIGIFFRFIGIVQGAEIIVRLDNPPQEGDVVILLFDSANAFGAVRDPTKIYRFASEGREVYRISDVPAGEYALVVYNDENGNGSLDKNFIGIPKEPVGFSRRYRPKGPPNYNRASFQLKEFEIRTFDIRLSSPMGKGGRLGIGIGLIGRSSPYRDYEGNVFQVIPAVTYISEHFQLFGPTLQIGLARIGDFALAARARYRFGAYEENDSPALTGLGDRKDTLMTGLALEYDLPGGIELSGGYEHDLVDTIGGGSARLGVEKSFRVGIARLSPRAGLKWLSAKLSHHDFGVPAQKARENRPAYRLDETFSIEVGILGFIEVFRNWQAIITIDVERLDDEITDSPIVSEEWITRGFAALNYVF